MNSTSVALNCQPLLGESPLWSVSRDRLLWVDTLEGSLNSFNPHTGNNTVYSLPLPLGFIVETNEGQLLVGIGCDIERFDEKSGRRQRVATAPHAQKGYRLNDACLDVEGRLWVGLINEKLSQGSGYLYCLNIDGSWSIIDTGFTLINGLSWSLDGKTLYVTDSRVGTIYAYEYDSIYGTARGRKTLIKIDPSEGKPDGLIVDHNGFLLSVLFDGAGILRISPDGNIIQRIPLPVRRPTSCAFDGRHQYLFVTSASVDLPQKELSTLPAPGALLQIDYEKIIHSEVSDGTARFTK